MPVTDPLSYSIIEDFRPGIWSTSARTLTAGGLKAPLGAADPSNTYRCYALESGALVPGPKQVGSINAPIPDASNVNNGGAFYVASLIAVGLIVSNFGGWPDELVYGVAYTYNLSGPQPNQPRFRLYRAQVPGIAAGFNISPTTDTLFTLNSAGTLNQFAGNSFTRTRANPTTPTSPGVPIAVISYSSGGGEDRILVYPDPNNPTTVSAPVAYNARADVIGHQGRVVFLTNSLYSHPTFTLTTNEQVNYTDPVNSFPTVLPGTFPSQNQVFVQEFPTGYGSWGSQSAGELFLVKHQGGGVLVSGDIASPTVTRLPGVMSTGGLTGQAVSTPIGLIYPTLSSGLWVWNGGNTSTKISPQLDGNFWGPISGPNFGMTFRSESWGQLVAFSNNWLFDTRTQAFWRLDNPATVQFQSYQRSWQEDILYCSVPSYTAGNTLFCYVYSQATPAASFRWQSHPIPVTQSRMVDVRRVYLVAQGSGTVTVSLIAGDGTVTALPAFTVSQTTTPQRFQIDGGVKGSNIALRIDSSGASIAPVVHSVGIGYHESSKAALT